MLWQKQAEQIWKPEQKTHVQGAGGSKGREAGDEVGIEGARSCRTAFAILRNSDSKCGKPE